MRAWLLAGLALVSTPALAGDVWIIMDSVEEDAHVHVELPADYVIEQTEAWPALHASRPTDLRTEVQILRTRPEGAQRSYHIDDGEGGTMRVDLHHRASQPGRVSTLDITAGDDQSSALAVSVPLEQGMTLLNAQWPDGTVDATWNVNLSDSDGKDELRALRGAGPTTLLEVRPLDGSKGLRIRLR